MPRPEKVQAVAEIRERLEDSAAVFLAEYAGLSVAEQQELRRGLRAAGGEFKIVKMTLARIAASELGHEDLVEGMTGPTGLAFAGGDAAAAAKALRDFAREHEQLILKGGLLSGEALTPERVQQLADLDSRDVLLAKIAGAFAAPLSNMAGLMAALPRNMASVLSQLVDQLPPADEPEPVEAAVEEPEPVSSEDAGDEGQLESADSDEPAEESAEAGDSGSEDSAAEAAEATEASEATTDEDTAEAAEED